MEMAACIGREKLSDQLFIRKVEARYWANWREIILRFKMMSAMIAEKHQVRALKMFMEIWKNEHSMKMARNQMKVYENEEKADGHARKMIIRRLMRRWKETADDERRQRVKAKTWRKVELWLSELRANRGSQ